jgi:hypothetical protein
VTWCSGMMMSPEGEVTPGRKRGGDDASSGDANLTGLKNEENPCDRFSCHKWTMNIESNNELIFLKVSACEI